MFSKSYLCNTADEINEKLMALLHYICRKAQIMRKLFLLASLILFVGSAMAQLVPTQTEAWLHITPNSTVKRLIDIDNVGNMGAQTYWEIIQDEVKSINGWDVEYCDCNNCYSFKDYPNSDTCDFEIPANDFNTYSLQIKPGTNIQTGTFKVVVHNLTDGSETDTLSFVVSDQAATGLVDRFAEEGYKLYPNPSVYLLKIAGTKGNESFKVYDVTGKTIAVSDIPSIDVSRLPVGAYILEVDNGETQIRQRFMKD